MCACFLLAALLKCLKKCYIKRILDMSELEETAAAVKALVSLCFLLVVLDQLTFSAADWIFDYQS